jgi:hypothetical protein
VGTEPRALRPGVGARDGDDPPRKANARNIAATNGDLRRAVSVFREDLYGGGCAPPASPARARFRPGQAATAPTTAP